MPLYFMLSKVSLGNGVGGMRKVGLTPYLLAAMQQVSHTLSKSDSHAFIHLLHATEGPEAEI